MNPQVAHTVSMAVLVVFTVFLFASSFLIKDDLPLRLALILGWLLEVLLAVINERWGICLVAMAMFMMQFLRYIKMVDNHAQGQHRKPDGMPVWAWKARDPEQVLRKMDRGVHFALYQLKPLPPRPGAGRHRRPPYARTVTA